MDQSLGTISRQVARAVGIFEKWRTNHSREWTAVFLNEDTVVIALHASLTPAENAQARCPAGIGRLREFHQQLFANLAATLFRKIKTITGMEVRNVVAEIEPTTGSVVQLFTTDTVGEDPFRDLGGPAKVLGPGDSPPCRSERRTRHATKTTGWLVRG